MQFIDLQSQLNSIRSEIEARIKTVLDHGQFIMGPEVYELEEKLADYVGVKHCVSCGNGTDALQLSLMAMGVGPGDIVFTTAFSFFATAEVIPLVGAKPYFVDIDSDTYNICPASLEKAIKRAQKNDDGVCKAVIAVDMFGLPANYPLLTEICKRYGLYLIEDAAQGFGGAIENEYCGSFGDIATTSFFPAKPLGCYGDGGAIFTDNDQFAQLCRSLRLHGKGSHKYENVRIGLNSRLDTVQAAILLEKFIHFETEIKARQTVAEIYSKEFKTNYKIPNVPSGYRSAWAQYSLQADDRQFTLEKLSQNKVPCGIYYPVALNEQEPFIDSLSLITPNAQQACEKVFSLPMHPYLSENEQYSIIKAITE